MVTLEYFSEGKCISDEGNYLVNVIRRGRHFRFCLAAGDMETFSTWD